MSDPNTIALFALDTVISALGVAIWLNSRQWVSREATFGSKLQVDALAAIDETELDQLDNRLCADCGYPVGVKPVFLGGVWFCATCNPAICVGGFGAE